MGLYRAGSMLILRKRDRHERVQQVTRFRREHISPQRLPGMRPRYGPCLAMIRMIKDRTTAGENPSVPLCSPSMKVVKTGRIGTYIERQQEWVTLKFPEGLRQVFHLRELEYVEA